MKLTNERMSAERLQEISNFWLANCGNCDAGMTMMCTCPKEDHRPVILELLREIERREEIENSPDSTEPCPFCSPRHGNPESCCSDKGKAEVPENHGTVGYQDLGQKVKEYNQKMRDLGYTSAEATLMTIGYDDGFRTGRLGVQLATIHPDEELVGYEAEISAIRKMYIEIFRDLLFEALAAMETVIADHPTLAVNNLIQTRQKIVKALKEVGVEIR